MIGVALGVHDGGGRRLLSPGRLYAGLGLQRGQVTSRATALGADGVTWSEFAADQPRFHGAARRLLVEGQRTNANPNPRAEGAVAGVLGSPGALPTGWVGTALSGGAVATILGTSRIDGVDCLLIRFNGTPNAISGRGIECGPTDTVAVGTLLTNSIFVALYAGTLTNVSALTLRTNTETGTVFTPTATLTRYTATRTMTNTGANTTLRWNYLDTSTPVDFTLAIGWPQREMGAAFASTPILPAVGAPAASTRGADLVTAALGDLGVAATGAGTLLLTGMIPQAAPAGTPQVVAQVDTGTDASAFALRQAAGGTGLVLGRSLSGATADSTSPGSVAAGAAFQCGVALNGAGRGAAAVPTAVQAVTGGPASGLAMLRLGAAAGGAQALFGELGSAAILPFAMPEVNLPAAVAALKA
jgi:hypothetical protein